MVGDAEMARRLEALGNTTRLSIFRQLVRAGHGGLPVAGLQERLSIPASTLSHHLHRLIATGLVTQERSGTTLICRAHYPAMDALIDYLTDACCVEAPTSQGDAQ